MIDEEVAPGTCRNKDDFGGPYIPFSLSHFQWAYVGPYATRSSAICRYPSYVTTSDEMTNSSIMPETTPTLEF